MIFTGFDSLIFFEIRQWFLPYSQNAYCQFALVIGVSLQSTNLIRLYSW